jgi:hypothetical protein
LQCLLGLTGGRIEGLGGLAQRVEVTELVGDIRQRLWHGSAHRALAVGDAPHDGHGAGLGDLASQRGEVVLGG